MIEINLGKNIFWTAVSRISAQGLIIFSTILLARRLGNAGFGEYAFISAVMLIANSLTTFGTDMLLIREIAARDELSRLSIALVLQLLLSGFFIILAWTFGAWFPNQSIETIKAMQIYSLALIPLAFFTVFTTALRGKQKMGAYNLLNLMMSILQVGIILLIPYNIISLFTALLIMQIVIALLASIICTLTIRDLWKAWFFSFPRLYILLKESAPIAVLVLLGMIYQRLSITMLSTMNGAAETGIYSAASRAVEASKIIHFAAFAAMYPAMARYKTGSVTSDSFTAQFSVTEGNDRTRDHMGLLGLLLAGTILISIILFLFSAPLMKFLYGNEFTVSASVLQILAWTLMPFTINSYLTLSFLASNREKVVGYVLIASLLALLTLNLLWIPLYGAQGGAWAVLVAECLQAIILLSSASSFLFLKGEASEFSKLSRKI